MSINEPLDENFLSIPRTENKELEQKAAELAKATREKGMGAMMGKFPPRILLENMGVMTGKFTNELISETRGYTSTGDFIQGGKFTQELIHEAGGFTSTGSFIQGEDMKKNIETRRRWVLVSIKTPRELQQKNPDRQIWTKTKYNPPMQMKKEQQTEEVKIKGFLGLPKTIKVPKTVYIETNNPETCNGKKGESDWIQFDYHMPTYHGLDGRPGIFVNLSFAVPPDIARQIDEQVEHNIYFPDAFFKALYPGDVGPDKKECITRIPAKELQIIDRTENKWSSKILQYPQPIPY